MTKNINIIKNIILIQSYITLPANKKTTENSIYYILFFNPFISYQFAGTIKTYLFSQGFYSSKNYYFKLRLVKEALESESVEVINGFAFL